MKRIVLSLFALIAFAGAIVPAAQAQDHHHKHCWYSHHHRHCRWD